MNPEVIVTQGDGKHLFEPMEPIRMKVRPRESNTLTYYPYVYIRLDPEQVWDLAYDNTNPLNELPCRVSCEMASIYLSYDDAFALFKEVNDEN